MQEVADLINSSKRQTMSKRPTSIIIFGPPGSGRTTIGKALAKKYNMAFVSNDSPCIFNNG